ncbi:group 1 truncated hemoglobin [Actinomycetospora sp. TBRC 11914]|uniref:group I truncated hemoglobin n=1 Tax=Actinomycetospora sp. TBRC 11914 TaxID=2729387 RepID=UPI00145D9F6A|nr:group 1 truncated hemoglobin [Actinomycetospora sp. TBRC 11914]NMO93740.1 group 1 truncated hemoglobin [Actinomycetospora sp. TBRC 11914]
MSGESLYERLGGTYAIAGAVDVLVDRLFENAQVNANEGVHAHHGDPANAPGYKFLVTAWSIEAAGGPKCYPGLDMVAAHQTLRITPEQFDAVSFEIRATLKFLGVPLAEEDEFMAIIEHYRPEVVEQSPVAPEGTLEPALAQA